MKICDDRDNPVAIFENYPYTWLGQQYFLSLELCRTDEIYPGQILVGGRTFVPACLMTQDDPRISEEFRKITTYLAEHPALCWVLQRIDHPVSSTEGYTLEVVTTFNEVSGPVYMGTASIQGRTLSDMLTLTWNAKSTQSDEIDSVSSRETLHRV